MFPANEVLLTVWRTNAEAVNFKFRWLRDHIEMSWRESYVRSGLAGKLSRSNHAGKNGLCQPLQRKNVNLVEPELEARS